MTEIYSVSGKTCSVVWAEYWLRKDHFKNLEGGGMKLSRQGPMVVFFLWIQWVRYTVDHKDTTVVAGSKLFINHTKHFRII